jgi:hypothetical protein
MNQNDFLDLFSVHGICKERLLDIALETGLIKRKRTIMPGDLLFSICKESISGTVSYNNIASQIEADKGKAVSRQAIWKKANEQCKRFFQKIMEILILSKIDNMEIDSMKRKSRYKRILIQDSTIIKLPQRLFDIFSGVSNGHSRACNARIQGTFDLIEEKFIAFSIDTYSENDMKAAPKLILEEGDLVLRDRGYFTFEEVNRHIVNSADCIYRYKHNTVLFNPTTKKMIDVNAELEKNDNLDIMVELNDKERTLVRFIASKTSEEVANKRRMKAKKENKSMPGKAYLRQLGWTIFLTTIPKEAADFNLIFDLYSIRWRIEIIFKSWKSNMGFSKIHNVSNVQLHIILLARFIMSIIFTQYIFKQSRWIVKKHLDKHLSLLKVTNYLVKYFDKLKDINFELSNYKNSIGNTLCILSKYCSYETRSRLNDEQKIDSMFH